MDGEGMGEMVVVVGVVSFWVESGKVCIGVVRGDLE
jgi:hypothetical protein